MKEVTDRWLNAWKKLLLNIVFLVGGIPTFGFLWVYLSERHCSWNKDEGWRLITVRALESWVHFWRGVFLFIAGFLTLGYTWFLMGHLDEPVFIGLRNKYRTSKL